MPPPQKRFQEKVNNIQKKPYEVCKLRKKKFLIPFPSHLALRKARFLKEQTSPPKASLILRVKYQIS